MNHVRAVNGSRDSAVSIVARLQAGQPWNLGSISRKVFHLSQERASGQVPTVLYLTGTRDKLAEA
jgi:hypothetical protein